MTKLDRDWRYLRFTLYPQARYEQYGILFDSDGNSISPEKPPNTPPKTTLLDGAEGFLFGLLLKDTVPVKRIQSEAKKAGFSWRTTQRAKALLRIQSMKVGRGWYWCSLF